MYGTPKDFWGKLKHNEHGQVVAWHPLFCHCADVAMCVKALLERSLIGQRLATLCGGSKFSDQQIERLAVLAALHDFGKVNHGFQAKAGHYPAHTAGHLREAQAALLNRHQDISSELIEALDLKTMVNWFYCGEKALVEFFRAILSHHGSPLTGMRVNASLWKPNSNRNPIAGVAQLTRLTKHWFPLAWNPGGDQIPGQAELQHAFTGLLILSDWIGSDSTFFPFAQKWPNNNYHKLAQRQAERAIVAMGLDGDSARQGLQLGTDLYHTLFNFQPRGAQRICLDLPKEAGPSVTVLEAETGAGKTEAALSRFASLFEAAEVDGLYFALPTRTAATQIHERVVEATARMFPDKNHRPAVVLAVPGYLRADDTDGTRLPAFEVLWPDDNSQQQRHRRWAAENTKRYLAGVIVIGTIDQVLLSTLMVNHSHLRATALLRHLLVIDEVHASDTYMTRLTETVLERHCLTGGHAFLMSATLGATARIQLLDSTNGHQSPSLSTAIKTPYPLVSHRNARGVISSMTVDNTDEIPPKVVTFELAHMADHPAKTAKRGLDAAKAGAKVIILRNTVIDCMATQKELELLAADFCHDYLFRCCDVTTPHHARYAAVDRKLLDEAINRSFGKTRKSGGCIAVTTQTVQQSLDLDADLLITDLCPMDVLLQRVGRLHRHERARAGGFDAARCIILVPDERDLSSFLESQRGKNKDTRPASSHGFGTVYEDLRIIEATWQILLNNPTVTIPNDNRRLVEATVHPEALKAIVDKLGPAWQKEQMRSHGQKAADRSTASLNIVRWDIPFDGEEMLFPAQKGYFAEGDNNGQRISTRLGEGNRRVEFQQPVGGPFGEPILELSIPAHMARRVPDEATLTNLTTDELSISFSLGDERFVYDRLGLRLQST